MLKPLSDGASIQITCPFCGLLCDDLSLPLNSAGADFSGLECRRAAEGFSAAEQAPPPQPLIGGKAVDWEEALAAAADLLKHAKQPLISGLIGDMQDQRAAVHLAEQCNGIIDHINGDSIARSLRVYQDSGWQITSLGEIRNRADLVILIGEDLSPPSRLREKVLSSEERLHRDKPPQIISLDSTRLEQIGLLRAVHGKRPMQHSIGKDTQALYAAIEQAQYPVFIVCALPETHGDIALRDLVGLVRELNESGRAALLPLGGDQGETSAQLTCAWHNGFGLRTRFSDGLAHQDLDRHSAERLLQEQDCDLLVWIASLSPQAPPDSDIKTVIIGHPATAGREQAGVFLPIAIPAYHRAGFLHRNDGLHLMPLRALAADAQYRDSRAVCRALSAHLNGGNA